MSRFLLPANRDEKEIFDISSTAFGSGKRAMDTVSYVDVRVSDGNSTSEAIDNGESFTGEWEERTTPELLVAVISDVDLTFKAQFANSIEDILAGNIDSTLTYDFLGSQIEPPHRLIIARRYFRIIVENSSGSNATYLRVQTSIGQFGPLTSALNSIVAQDADALVVRPTDFFVEVGEGRHRGYSFSPKMGQNTDISAGSVPEAITNLGGTYAGFPTGAAEEFQITCGAGDVGGSVTFAYLSSFTATEWQSATVTLTGTSTNTGVSGVRAHTMSFNSGSSTTFNVSVVTLRHATTTSNVFLDIAIGRSQSNYAVYTIPYNSTGLITALKGQVRKAATSVSVSGSIWVRNYGDGPRYRRPFTVYSGLPYYEPIPSGLTFPALSDIQLVILNSSGNNLEVVGGFDLYTIRKAPN